jgi:3-dehydroquinate synthase
MIERSVKTIRVQTEPPYNVLIGRGLLARALASIERELKPTKTLVVTSRRIFGLHGKKLSLCAGANAVFIPDGERAKTLRTYEQVIDRFARAGSDRRACVIAFGGGVVGDLAGFAAASYLRGIPVVQIPTTLLAQVDAAVGGKTGVNLPQGKNLVGAFHQPSLVVIDTDVLTTLPEREFRAGVFEVIKCGVIRDASLLSYLEKNADKILARDADALGRIVSAAVNVKADVVSADEKESDLRRILNFGHTIGHALEAATNYRKLLHGEAVGLGMIAAAEIGVNIGITPLSVAERIISCVLQYSPLPQVKVKPAQVIKHISSDKKTLGSLPHFVIVDKIGSTVIRNDVPREVILRAIRSVIA